MIRPIFESLEEIPDPIDEALLLPSSRLDLRVPKESEHTAETTSPVEISYSVCELDAGGFSVGLQLLETTKELELPIEEVLPDWGNHLLRAVFRAALDPDRYAPILMPNVYSNEYLSARFPDAFERMFFDGFVRNFGVLDREISNTTS